ncbi:MAG: carboxylating nicotinate-nucleotide diphosphorylase [Planctomycetota bacterium]|nr:carboxylating nicotinate-nucleotide diphosphorylase [Planctomycetota bacterium]MDA1211677.1 carboxylating nicotinate-nucleotide diphosphorylase [Planctomycetota bacterium]
MTSPTFGPGEEQTARTLISLAVAEDFGTRGDVTSQWLIPADQQGTVDIVSRQHGIWAGGPVGKLVFEVIDPSVKWTSHIEEGASVAPGTSVVTISGAVRSLLGGERTVLNFLGRLSGIASATQKYVAATADTKVRILDTRKTLPAYRLLDKYAVRAGGGHNHRIGLYDGCLIKDNHLGAWRAVDETRSLADAVKAARANPDNDLPIEVEVDDLNQLADVLMAHPQMVLLDNMNAETLKQAVAMRDQSAPGVLLEASGGITLENVAEVAQSGVDRISIGALTHSVIALDLSFDWR